MFSARCFIYLSQWRIVLAASTTCPQTVLLLIRWEALCTRDGHIYCEKMESDYAQWTTVVAAMAVGLSMVVVLWLCGHCDRQIELRRVVSVDKQTLFNFLCDPHNLKIIHPYT